MKLPIFLPRRSTVKDTLLCAHQAVLADRLADFLRTQHPSNTAKEVARKADVPSRTVEHWLAGLSSPRLPHFLKLLHAYGPALLKAAMDDASLKDMRKEEGFDWVERLRVAEDQDKATAELERVTDALKALTDTRPNHRPYDRPEEQE